MPTPPPANTHHPTPASPHIARRGRWWGSQCRICRQGSDTSLCGACNTLWQVQALRCPACALRQHDGLTCSTCSRQPPPQRHTRVGFDYAFPWDALVQQWKFARATGLTPLLASRLIQAAQADATWLHEAQPVFLPVPLTRQRLRQRGYNQSALLAAALARHFGLRWRDDLITRPVERPHQAGLTRAQRQTNLQGVFLVEPRWRPWLSGRSVVLVDDVITTGATTAEAVRELLRVGAAQVAVYALARTA
jgi:ComF family protein